MPHSNARPAPNCASRAILLATLTTLYATGCTDGGSDSSGTTIYPGHPEQRLASWQAYELYFADELLD